jgi:hypothetical protein
MRTAQARQPAAHPLAVVNPLADTHATIDEDLELCDELGGAKYGLTLGKYRAWTGPAARLAGRVAYVHHGRLFILDDEPAWPGERAMLARPWNSRTRSAPRPCWRRRARPAR